MSRGELRRSPGRLDFVRRLGQVERADLRDSLDVVERVKTVKRVEPVKSLSLVKKLDRVPLSTIPTVPVAPPFVSRLLA